MNISVIRNDTLPPLQYTLRADINNARYAFHLEAHPEFGIFPIRDASRTEIGLVLGFPIDLEQRRVVTESITMSDAMPTAIDAAAGCIGDRLGGRYLLFLNMNGKVRIYPDGAAQLPCIYMPENGIAGATAYALLSEEDYEGRFRHDLYATLDIENDGWFPGGLTAHEGVERLLPNHFLDLGNWTQTRYWPVQNIERTGCPQKNIEEIAQIVRIQIEALINSPWKVAQALTAGQDTRIMLACVRPYIDAIEFVTIAGSRVRDTDTVISKRIAGDLGLNHNVLARAVADEDTVARYMRRGGHCVGGPNRLIHPSLKDLRQSHVFVGGASGEIGRAFFWNGGDGRETPLDGHLMVGRMGLPAVAELQDRLGVWLEGLQEVDPLIALDLAYIEQRVGPWGGAQMFSDPTFIRHNPLGNTRILKLMLSLPDDWKRHNRLTHELIGRFWPELLRYPFNSQGFFSDFLSKARRSIRQPKLVIRKFRKLRR